jgi:hypothetical protein
MKKALTLFASAMFFLCSHTHAYTRLPGHFIVEGGAFYSSQGQSQIVAIDGLIGDQYNVTNRHDWGSIAGIGYLLDGPQWGRVTLDYGINVFYLSKTKVSGLIKQEMLYNNMAFQYYVDNLPLYAVVKALVDTNFYNLTATIDAGLGPNFMATTQFKDPPLNDYTIPDNAYSGHPNVTFSAMAGVGLRYNLMNTLPVEIGYRFFYLGSGYLNPNNPAVLNQLKSGKNIAQALLFTISI